MLTLQWLDMQLAETWADVVASAQHTRALSWDQLALLLLLLCCSILCTARHACHACFAKVRVSKTRSLLGFRLMQQLMPTTAEVSVSDELQCCLQLLSQGSSILCTAGPALPILPACISTRSLLDWADTQGQAQEKANIS